MIRKLVYALRFMTILPIPWRENEDLVQVSRSSSMFPLVGLFIGALLWLTGQAGSYFFSESATAFLQTTMWVLLTGGLHLDGLSDTFDGLGCRRDREKTLEVMKDSRLGAFGALSLILQVGLKFVFIQELNRLGPLLILIPPVTGRWGQLISIYSFPSARKDGMGRFFREHIRHLEVFFGLICTVVICLWLMSWTGLVLLILHGVFVYLISLAISRKLGGLTGDVYGLVCETGESVTLILLPVLLSVL